MKKITLPIAILLIAFLGCCDPQPDPPVVDNAYLILGSWWQEGVDAFQDDTLIFSRDFTQDSTVVWTFKSGGDLVGQYFADTVVYWQYNLSGDSLQYLKVIADRSVYDYTILTLDQQDLKYMWKDQNADLIYRWKRVN